MKKMPTKWLITLAMAGRMSIANINRTGGMEQVGYLFSEYVFIKLLPIFVFYYNFCHIARLLQHPCKVIMSAGVFSNPNYSPIFI